MTDCSANGLNVRDNPSINVDVVGTLNKGANVKITGKVVSWFEIGPDKYISGAYVDLSNPKPIEY